MFTGTDLGFTKGMGGSGRGLTQGTSLSCENTGTRGSGACKFLKNRYLNAAILEVFPHTIAYNLPINQDSQ